MIPRVRGFLSSLLVLALVPLAAQAQGTGTISGRVTGAAGQPLSDTRVSLVGTTRGAMTAQDGSYRITAVPAGTYQVRAIRLGFAALTKPVTVAEGGSAEVSFTLSETATIIDQVVVTATGEEQRKRESGNLVSTVDVTPEKLAAVTTMAQLITGKAPGVYVNSPGGTTGSASRIRIRGANSVSLTNEPLIMIDGVRVNNDIGGQTNDGTLGVGGQQSTRINDVNPDDVESVEVIKGPAAAALYGTAAANGVIQIRTKRGRAGATRWTLHSEAGSQEDKTKYPANFAQIGTTTAGARTQGCTLDAQTRNACVPNPDSLVSFNPLMQASPFIKGYRTSFGASVTGGGDRATYFISADADRDQGVVEPNQFRRATVRANLTGQLRPTVTTQVFSNFISSRLEFPQNDNNILGVVSGGLLGSAFDNPTSHGYLAGQTPQEIYAQDTRENIERFIGSNLTTWQAMPWLTATMQAGLDFTNRRNQFTLQPNKVFFNSTTAEGSRNANTTQLWTYTGNGSLTANRDITPTVRSSTTAGVQFTREVFQGTRASGGKLIAGSGSLEGTSTRFTVGERNTDNRTLGGLIQQQVSWKDRLFATAALRTDNNSAFGSNFGWIRYPAASLSWVVSEEDFFPKLDAISMLRLRTAYGESGQRPNFRDAITFFNTQTVTTAAGDLPGILVGGTGNADLKPERSGEFEIGFELGLLNNRFSIDFTSYNKHTKDLLIARPLPPSLGLTTTQFDNLGESSNKGIEFQLNGMIYEMTNARFDLTVAGSTNDNKLTSIGLLPTGAPIPPIVFGIQRHAEGFPLGGYWANSFKFDDKNKDGIISRLNCPGQTNQPGGPECEMLVGTLTYLGNPIPRRELTVNPRLTLFQNVELGALIDHRGGFMQFNNTARFRCNFNNCEEAYNKNTPLERQARNLGQLMGTDAGYVEKSDYTKLREVTVSFLTPKSWANMARASELRLTLAGRNLKTWTDYTGFDPEVNSTPANLFSTSDFLTQPPLRVFTARLTASF